MYLSFLLCLELIVLYFLSRALTKSLYVLFLLLFRARSVAISILLLLHFPGTVIHELAHLFTAEILRVPTGKLTLVPESIRDTTIKSGSVAIAQTDPFRRYAIGLAPLSAGMLVLSAISYFLPQTSSWAYWGLLYLLFSISNSMFSSPEDIRGFGPFAAVITVFLLAGYFVGLRFSLSGQALVLATQILTTLTQTLQIVLLVNIVLLVASWGLKTALFQLFGARVVQIPK